MKRRILIADDHEIVREGLRGLIEKEPDMEVVAEAADGQSAVKLAQECTPDLIIMDISMPDMNGIDATHQLLAELAGVKVIALSMHSDKRFVIGMLRAGASGYLLKECAFREMRTAMGAVFAGQTYLSPKIAAVVVKAFLHQDTDGGSYVGSELTLKERQVLQLIAEGHTTRHISATLHISVKTVEARRKKIMRKLKLDSIAALTKYALKEGLTAMDL
ncbi:MAG: response regulator transcription factor [Desulfosarcinaceae bacterium]|nr:response regulator transcription factor [Desulfosarcinaceae bacterium]